MDDNGRQLKVGIKLSPRELLEAALLLEKRGIEFYRLLADECEDGSLRDFFLQLVGMEIKHEKALSDLIASLKDEPPGKAPFDDALDDREFFAQLKQLAASKSFPEGFDALAMVEGSESPRDLLPLALEIEERAIKIYRAFSRFDLDHRSARVAAALLGEEEKHKRDIMKIMARLGA